MTTLSFTGEWERMTWDGIVDVTTMKEGYPGRCIHYTGLRASSSLALRLPPVPRAGQ